MELAAELEAHLREFTSASAVEVCETGSRAISFHGLSWEVRGAAAKPLLHLWSEQYNLTRRVLAITDRSESRLALAVERFGRGQPDRLEFVRLDFARPARELSREEFCERLRRILAEQFPTKAWSLWSFRRTWNTRFPATMPAGFCAAAQRNGPCLPCPMANPRTA